MDTTTEARVLFGDHPTKRLLLLDIIFGNLDVSSNLDNAVRHAEKHLVDADDRKNNKCPESFLATYSSSLVPC